MAKIFANVLGDPMDPATVFGSRRLKGKLLAAVQAARSEHGEGEVSGPVMRASELRTALAETLGEEVPSKDLFPLMQMADPDSEGVITLPRFLEVVKMRRIQAETERRQRQLLAAYMALGGNTDKDALVKSDTLSQIVSDFVGAGASKEAMQAVVKHKMKSVQDIIAMGGTLDSDEEEEIRDTSKLEFEQLEVFGGALKEWGSSRSVTGTAEDGIDEDGVSAAILR